MNLHHWNEIPTERLNESVTRKAFHTGQMTIARLVMSKGAKVPRHHHVNEQVTNVESGSLLFFFDDSRIVVNAGESLAIPPNVPHAVDALEDSVALDLFTPRREDWISGDDAYLRGGGGATR